MSTLRRCEDGHEAGADELLCYVCGADVVEVEVAAPEPVTMPATVLGQTSSNSSAASSSYDSSGFGRSVTPRNSFATAQATTSQRGATATSTALRRNLPSNSTADLRRFQAASVNSAAAFSSAIDRPNKIITLIRVIIGLLPLLIVLLIVAEVIINALFGVRILTSPGLNFDWYIDSERLISGIGIPV